MKAIMNGEIIAESNDTIVIENNHYFPPDSIKRKFLRESTHRSTCPWKGEAHYYDVVVEGKESKNAAWHYPQPKEAAEEIAGYLAFWKRVQVTD
ncbi:DUF427 domain-containing protein [Candidatus Bipolaricaulota bacterium]|nr:DUF427 domain-containing protein [Candidatus Bipolaricaulota bacterium]MCK5586614.1 DUF427 domain-containing protein [Candidatus Bipolaricaulota bacterium]